jgi:hypothetical protein
LMPKLAADIQLAALRPHGASGWCVWTTAIHEAGPNLGPGSRQASSSDSSRSSDSPDLGPRRRHRPKCTDPVRPSPSDSVSGRPGRLDPYFMPCTCSPPPSPWPQLSYAASAAATAAALAAASAAAARRSAAAAKRCKLPANQALAWDSPLRATARAMADSTAARSRKAPVAAVEPGTADLPRLAEVAARLAVRAAVEGPGDLVTEWACFLLWH